MNQELFEKMMKTTLNKISQYSNSESCSILVLMNTSLKKNIEALTRKSGQVITKVLGYYYVTGLDDNILKIVYSDDVETVEFYNKLTNI